MLSLKALNPRELDTELKASISNLHAELSALKHSRPYGTNPSEPSESPSPLRPSYSSIVASSNPKAQQALNPSSLF